MFPSWVAGNRKAADEVSEFGLELDASPGSTPHDELSDWSKPSKKISDSRSYGSISERKSYASPDAYAELLAKFHNYALQAFAILAVIWVWYLVVHRYAQMFSAQSSSMTSASPSPSPGSGSSAPICSSYTYPQCEVAMEWYLSRNAASRCQAFEHVKAEGDLFKFPYSSSQQDMCELGRPGCCGCPGQCSKCPPLLAECESWQIDGSWKIAFREGKESTYTFDAHGHYHLEVPSSSLPVNWKWYDQAFIPNGSDIGPPQLLSVSDAKNRCREDPHCKGITYDEASNVGNNVYEVFFKLVSTVSAAPGTGWKTFVEEARPELHDVVAVAGPLVRTGSNASGTFRLDLHSAAPQLFPSGCFEQLTLQREELRVERQCPGMATQIGQGLRIK